MFPLKRGLGPAGRSSEVPWGSLGSIAAFGAAFCACSQGGVLAYRDGKGNHAGGSYLKSGSTCNILTRKGRQTIHHIPARDRAGKRDSSFFDPLLRTTWPSARRAPRVAPAAGPGAAT